MGDTHDAALAQLMAMGFSHDVSLKALRSANGDIERAAAILLSSSISPSPNSSFTASSSGPSSSSSLTATSGHNGHRSAEMRQYDEQYARALQASDNGDNGLLQSLGPRPDHPAPVFTRPTSSAGSGAPAKTATASGSGGVQGVAATISTSNPSPSPSPASPTLDAPETKRGPTTALPPPPAPSLPSSLPPSLPSTGPPALPVSAPPVMPPVAVQRVSVPPVVPAVIAPLPSAATATPMPSYPSSYYPPVAAPVSYARHQAWTDQPSHQHQQASSSPVAAAARDATPRFDHSIFGSPQHAVLSATGTPLAAPPPGTHSFIHAAPPPAAAAYVNGHGHNPYHAHPQPQPYHPIAHHGGHHHNGSMGAWPPQPQAHWQQQPSYTPVHGHVPHQAWQQPAAEAVSPWHVSSGMAAPSPIAAAMAVAVAAPTIVVQREICPIFLNEGTCVLLEMDPDHGNQWLHSHAPQPAAIGAPPSSMAPAGPAAPPGCEGIARHQFGRCNLPHCLITEMDDAAHHWMFNHASVVAAAAAAVTPSLSSVISPSGVPFTRDPSNPDPFSPRPVDTVAADRVSTTLADGLTADGLVIYKNVRYCTFAPCPKLSRHHPEYDEHKNSRKHFCEHGALCSRLHDAEHRNWYFHADPQPCAEDDDECQHVPSSGAIRDLLTTAGHHAHHQQNIHMLLYRHRCPLGVACPSLAIIADDSLISRNSCHNAIYIHPCAAGLECTDGRHPRDGAAHQLHWTHPCAMAQHCKDKTSGHLRQYTHDHQIKGNGTDIKASLRQAPPPLVGFFAEPSCSRGAKCPLQYLDSDHQRCKLDHKESKITEATAGKAGMRNPIKDFWYAPNQPVLVTMDDGTRREGWTRGREVVRTANRFPWTNKIVVCLSDADINTCGNHAISRTLVLVSASQCTPMDDGKVPNPLIGGPLSVTISVADMPRIAPALPDCKFGSSCNMLSPQHHNHVTHCGRFAHPTPATAATTASVAAAAATATAAAGAATAAATADVRASFAGRRWNAPWYHPLVRAWKSDLTRELQRVLSTKIVPGLAVNYMTVITEFHDNGYACFVMGGAVRDCLMGGGGAFAETDPEDMKIKDIDLGFGCSALEAKAMCEAKGWPSSINHTGLVTLGTRVGTELVLEGKAMMGLNADYAAASHKEPHKYPFTISCDLRAENCYGDFTANRLWYDAVNQIIWDPTGLGVHDSVHRLLRIPVTISERDQWVEQNPTKLLRYWKMKCRRFQPVDDDTHIWFVKKTNELFGVAGHALKHTPEWFIKYLGKDATGFRSGIQQDLGRPWWDRWFEPFWQKYHRSK